MTLTEKIIAMMDFLNLDTESSGGEITKQHSVETTEGTKTGPGIILSTFDKNTQELKVEWQENESEEKTELQLTDEYKTAFLNGLYIKLERKCEQTAQQKATQTILKENGLGWMLGDE